MTHGRWNAIPLALALLASARDRLLIANQTYGDLVNFHPHLHALVTDGAFSPTGWFVAFPKIDLYALEHLFRHRVLRMLLRERRIDETVIRKLLGWRHSGFSLHNAVRIGPHDAEGRRAVSEYVLRSPFSLEKLRYQATTGTIIYGTNADHRVYRAARGHRKDPDSPRVVACPGA